MPDRWIIRVDGKEYGPVDLEVLKEWKQEGRLLPANQARPENEAEWATAAAIPGLFKVDQPPIQKTPVADWSTVNADSAISVQKSDSRPPTRKIFTETFQIYFRGFFQFLGLTLLIIVPSLCSQFSAATIQSAPNVNADLRTLMTGAFSVCMYVLSLVLWPVYVAGIQILSVELTGGGRVRFPGVLNHAVKYWPRVAGLCIFVYAVLGLIMGFGLGVAVMMLFAAVSASLFSVVFALGLSLLQIWLFARFFINVLFWQQFAVLENATAIEALRASRNLARSGSELPWYQRPLWRAAIIVSLWCAFYMAVEVLAYWPKIVAEWPLIQTYYNQLMSGQDPQAILQQMMANVPRTEAINLREVGWNILLRIVQPLIGIAFVVLYLDCKGDRESLEAGING
jgi:GYF domain 2